MIDTQDIDKLENATDPLDPPEIALLCVDTPTIKRIAPTLTCGAEIIGWHSRHRLGAPAARFDAKRPGNKRYCKRALLKEFNLDEDLKRPLFGIVSRLSEQKGIDLVLSAIAGLQQLGGTLVILGSGEPALEQACRDAAQRAPQRVGVHIGYDETRAHRLIAGADVLLVPSRFEPCGLTQLYALRYGTLPLVRRVGGLADTIDDTVGFPFGPQDTGFAHSLEMAIAAYHHASRWRALRHNAMLREHGWSQAALDYLALYRRLLDAD